MAAGGVAGGAAAVIARLCIAPAERVKIRVQVTPDPVSTVVRAIWREEGLLGFWRGVGASVVRVAPYFGVKFLALEQFKGLLRRAFAVESKSGAAAMALGFGAGSLAGMTAVCATYPFDVLRARMAAYQVPPPPAPAAPVHPPIPPYCRCTALAPAPPPGLFFRTPIFFVIKDSP